VDFAQGFGKDIWPCSTWLPSQDNDEMMSIDQADDTSVDTADQDFVDQSVYSACMSPESGSSVHFDSSSSSAAETLYFSDSDGQFRVWPTITTDDDFKASCGASQCRRDVSRTEAPSQPPNQPGCRGTAALKR
jgi:hypothetical protein